MNKPPLQMPAVTHDEVLKAVGESLAWLVRSHSSVAPGIDVDPVLLANAILMRLADYGGHAEDRRTALIALPLNLAETGAVAFFASRGSVWTCNAIIAVGPGRFVFGSGNDIFGQWDALVAASSTPSCTIFPAHGGEIIPGTIEDHVTRIRQNLVQGTSLPVQVDIDVSMACPSSCVFCFSADYRASRTTGRMMSTELLLRLVQQWAEFEVKVVRFDGGGDPLTHPGLLRAIDLCRDLRLRTAVLTAGDLLSKRHIPTFLRARTYLRVSLNAASDETRRLLHGRHNNRYGLSHIFDFVTSLATSRDEALGAAGPSVMPIGATSMIHPANVAETVSIAMHAKNAGFDHLSFRVILGTNHRVSFTTSQRMELDAAFDEVVQTVAGPKFRVFIPSRDVTDRGYVPSRYFSRCRASTHRALVEVGPVPDRAAIVPCGRYRGQGYRPDAGPDRVVFGYLDNNANIKDVWLQPSMRQLLESFPSRCEDCIDRSANTLLESIETILREDLDAVFFPFSKTDCAGGD